MEVLTSLLLPFSGISDTGLKAHLLELLYQKDFSKPHNAEFHSKASAATHTTVDTYTYWIYGPIW
jgi:hypothetical protein